MTHDLSNMATTKKSVYFRDMLAKDWEYEQYECSQFEARLISYVPEFIIYHVYQYQTKDGHRFVHGMIRCSKPVKYACIHLLIGKGDYCNIKVARNPAFVRLECCLLDGSDDPVEYGLFEIRKVVSSSNLHLKKSTEIIRPPVDVTFAEYLLTQDTLTETEKHNLSVFYPYHQ